MTEKKYTGTTTERKSRARSKRLREAGGNTIQRILGSGVASSVSPSAASAAWADRAGYAREAGHALNADEADLATRAAMATVAQNLAEDSTDWSAISDMDLATLQLAKLYTDTNALSKVSADTAQGLIRLAAGLKVGSGDYGISANGDALLKDIEAQGLQIGSTYREGMLGEGGVFRMNDGKSYLEVDQLTVRLKAYFAELEIRRLSYSGGNLVFSAAASKIEEVIPVDAGGNPLSSDNPNYDSLLFGYKCYFVSDDGTTATVNDWRVGDQARCQTFNIDSGKHSGVSNRYYWRKVLEAESDNGATSDEGKKRNWVVLAAKVFFGTRYNKGMQTDVTNDIPQAGDTIVQLGNQNTATFGDRQNAITLETNSTTAPAIYKYQGIDDFSLEGKMVQADYYESANNTYKSVTYGDWYVGAKPTNNVDPFANNASTYVRFRQNVGGNPLLEIRARIDALSPIMNGNTEVGTMGDIASLNSIKTAFNGGTTTIGGGLILTNAIAMRNGGGDVTAGISGLTDGNTVAAWFGGTPSTAKSLFRFDGSGYLAGGNISWNVGGDTTVQGTIKAKNLYHNVGVFREGEGGEGLYIGGKVYTYNNGQTDVTVHTTGDSDIVYLQPVNWQNPWGKGRQNQQIIERTVNLPPADEYPGKVIELFSYSSDVEGQAYTEHEQNIYVMCPKTHRIAANEMAYHPIVMQLKYDGYDSLPEAVAYSDASGINYHPSLGYARFVSVQMRVGGYVEWGWLYSNGYGSGGGITIENAYTTDGASVNVVENMILNYLDNPDGYPRDPNDPFDPVVRLSALEDYIPEIDLSEYLTIQDAQSGYVSTSGLTSALAGYVTLNTVQEITAEKTFKANVWLGAGNALKSVDGDTDLLAYKSGTWGGVTGAHWFVGAAGVNGFIRSAGELTRWVNSSDQYTIWDSSNLNLSAWAKAANKPTYNLDEVQDGTTRKLSDYALSQDLHDLDLATVKLAGSQTITGAKRFTADIHIGENRSGASPKIYWGDGSYVWIGEDSDDHFKIHASNGIRLDGAIDGNLTLVYSDDDETRSLIFHDEDGMLHIKNSLNYIVFDMVTVEGGETVTTPCEIWHAGNLNPSSFLTSADLSNYWTKTSLKGVKVSNTTHAPVPSGTDAGWIDLSDEFATVNNAISGKLSKNGDTMNGNLTMRAGANLLIKGSNGSNAGSLYAGTLTLVGSTLVNCMNVGGYVNFINTDDAPPFANGKPLATQEWANGQFVTALGVSGDSVTYIKNGSTTNLTVPFATTAMGFKRLNKATAETWDANTMTVNGTQYALLTNYRSTAEWANMPTGMSWGGVLQITAGSGVGYLSGQLAWDSNHNVTTGVTRKLYWRSRNSTGWGTNDWHTIAFEDWVTSQIGNYLPLTGGTLTGDLTISKTGSMAGVWAENRNGGYDIKFQANGKNHQLWFGIGSGDENRGIYGYDRDPATGVLSNSKWMIYFRDGNTIMNYGNLIVNGALNFGQLGGISMDNNTAVMTIGANGGANFVGDTATPLKSNGSPVITEATLPSKLPFQYLRNTSSDNDEALGIERLILPLTVESVSGKRQATLNLSGYLPLTAGANKPLTGSLYLNNATYIYFKDTQSTSRNAIGINSLGDFLIGYGTSSAGCNTHLYGKNIYFRNGTTQGYAMMLNADGNVGIGTTTPTKKLDVAGGIHLSEDILLNKERLIYFKDNAGTSCDALSHSYDDNAGIDTLYLGFDFRKSSHTTEIYGNQLTFHTGTSGRERMVVTSGGNVGIGTSSPMAMLHVNGNARIGGTLTGVTNIDGLMVFDSTNNKVTVGTLDVTTLAMTSISVGDTGYKMSITSDDSGVSFSGTSDGYSFDDDIYAVGGHFTGSMTVGSSSNVTNLTVNGRARFGNYVGIGTEPNTSYALDIDGSVRATSYANGSDIRMKDVTRYLELSAMDIARAPVIEFTWKNGNGHKNIGSIAQYWEKVLPQAVCADDSGMLSMEYGTIALASAVTAARHSLDNERRIAELELRVAELESLLESYEISNNIINN